MSALLAVLWLNLIALPCVMAQPFSTAGADCISCPDIHGRTNVAGGTTPGATEQDSADAVTDAVKGAAETSGMDCAAAQHCAVMLDEQPGTLAKVLPYALAQPVMQPLWAYVFLAPRAVFQPPSSYYSALTPLERLPVLRI